MNKFKNIEAMMHHFPKHGERTYSNRQKKKDSSFRTNCLNDTTICFHLNREYTQT